MPQPFAPTDFEPIQPPPFDASDFEPISGAAPAAPKAAAPTPDLGMPAGVEKPPGIPAPPLALELRSPMKPKGSAPDPEQAAFEKSLGNPYMAGANALTGLDPTGVVPGVVRSAKGVGKVITGNNTLERVAGGREALAGAFDAATSGMVSAGFKAPVKTAASIAFGTVTQQGVEEGLKRLGLPKEWAGLLGDLSGVVAGVASHQAMSPEAVRAIREHVQNVVTNVDTAGFAVPGDSDTGSINATKPEAPAGPPEAPPPTSSDTASEHTPNPPTAATPTAPESPTTIAAQTQQLGEGKRRVVMLPKGTEPPAAYPENVSVTSDGLGNTYLYRRDMISESEVKSAASNNTLPEVLGSAEDGMGAPDKTALEGPPAVVTARAADGTEVQSTATDEASLPRTIAATQAVMPEGGSVAVEPPADVLAGREAENGPQAEAAPADTAPPEAPPAAPVEEPPPAGEAPPAPEAAAAPAGEEVPPAPPLDATEPPAPGMGDYQSFMGSGAIGHSLRATFDQDIVPKMKALGQGLVEMFDGLRKLAAPATRGKDARFTSLSIREAAADRARAYDHAEHITREATGIFAKVAGHADSADPTVRQQARDYILDFYTRAEKGLPQANPELQQSADVLQALLKDRLRKVKTVNPKALQNYIENYLPHMYKDPVKAKAIIDEIMQTYGTRRFVGKTDFLKQRTIPFLEDAIRKRGLEPYSWNPVDMTMLRLVQMDKYIMAHTVFNELSAQKLLHYVPSGEKLPDGYRWIDDDIATAYGPRKGAVKLPPNVGSTVNPANVTVYGRRIMGKYAAPEPVARVINNHLSPGLRSNEFVNKGYEAWRGAGNWLNQFQLGFSAFHAGFTSFDAITSKVALALVQASRGDFGKAAKSIAAAPLSPITQALGLGNKLIREWDSPGSQGTAITELVNAMKAGGWRGSMDRVYKTRIADNMLKAWRSGNILGAGARLPFAAVETLARPVLEWLVPRQKAALMADIMRYEMEKNPNMTHQQLREIAAQASDSADNRMGQMVYDNQFWNRTMKDILHGATRSVGWNVGTVKELGGGVLDLHKLFTSEHKLSYRASYGPALLMTTATTGALMAYMMTGKAPQTWKDVYFPPTGNLDEHGNPERVNLPTYLKDIYHYGTDPVKTVTNKLHPLANLVADAIRGSDYYNVEIRNPGDSLAKQAYDTGKFVVKQAAPFSIMGAKRQHELGTSPWLQAANFIGITPAPSDLDKTAAQKLADQYAQSHRSSGKRDAGESEHFRAMAGIEREIRLGHDPRQKIEEAKAKGLITQKDLPTIHKRAKTTPLQASVQTQGVTVREMLDVYAKASPEERKSIQVFIRKKLMNARSKPYEWRNASVRDAAAKYFNIQVAAPKDGTETPDLGIPDMGIPGLGLQ